MKKQMLSSLEGNTTNLSSRWVWRPAGCRDLPHPLLLGQEEKQPCFTRDVEDPRVLAGRATSGMTTGLMGFTLIELLVIVLIIGILAAVALPQYKLAVAKSRFATYRTLAEGLVASARTYHMASGEWPSQLDQLDVELPAGMTMTSHTYASCGYTEKMYCCVIPPRKNSSTGSIICGDKPYTMAYEHTWAGSSGTETIAHRCLSKEQKICKSFGGKHVGSTSSMTPDGVDSGYFYYNLP